MIELYPSVPIVVLDAPPFHRCPFDGVHEPVCFIDGARDPIHPDTRAAFCRTQSFQTCPKLAGGNSFGHRERRNACALRATPDGYLPAARSLRRGGLEVATCG
jgi:hypothetical protein